MIIARVETKHGLRYWTSLSRDALERTGAVYDVIERLPRTCQRTFHPHPGVQEYIDLAPDRRVQLRPGLVEVRSWIHPDHVENLKSYVRMLNNEQK